MSQARRLIIRPPHEERPELVRPFFVFIDSAGAYEQPLVEPQVSHFRQVPFRTMVKLPHSEQLSPS